MAKNIKVGSPVVLTNGTRGRVSSLRTAPDGVVEVTITRIGGTLVVPAGLVEVL